MDKIQKFLLKLFKINQKEEIKYLSGAKKVK
jgi:hypothetical protein